jgi:hypothetical protein
MGISLQSADSSLKKRRWFSSSSSREAIAMKRMKVVNVTRNTVLATSVEVADSGAKRSKGLLGRSGLGQGEGLWIVPCESVHTFAMRFSLDLVYLDRHHRIRKIRKNVPPWRISFCLTAHSILELAAGVIGPQDAQRGDQVQFYLAE